MNPNNEEFDYGEIEDERGVFNPDGQLEEKVDMEIRSRKSSRPPRPTQLVRIRSNKFLNYEMGDDDRSKARKRQRKGTIDQRSLLRQQMLAAQMMAIPKVRRGRKAHSPMRTMAEKIRRRKRADKMKERQLKARIRAREKAARLGKAIQTTLLSTHISSPQRAKKSSPLALRNFAHNEERREAIRREAEAQARIRRRDVERRRKARERMARSPAILSMNDFDLGPSVAQVAQSSREKSFNLQETLNRMERLYPRRGRARSPPRLNVLVSQEFQEMTERFDRQAKERRKRLKDRMRRVATGKRKNFKKVDKKALRRMKKEETILERMKKEEKTRPRRIGEIGWEGVRRKENTAIPRIVRITGLGEDISGNPIVYFRAQGGGSSQMSLEKFEREFQTLDEYLKEYDAGLKKKKAGRKGKTKKVKSPARQGSAGRGAGASGFKVGDVVKKVKGARAGEKVTITKVSGNKVAGVFESDGKKVRMQSSSNFK